MSTDTLLGEGNATQTADATAQAPAAGTPPEAGAAAVTQQPASDTQKAEGAQPEAKTESEADKPKGAPDKYEFKAPEGREFDSEVLAQYSEVAKELNLSQDDAQKMIDKLAPAMVAKQERVMAEARDAWSAGAKADKEIGGDKFDENLGVAKKALDTFGSPELKALLNESGLGNHPEIIRAFYRAGKAISEDTFVGGKPATTKSQSLAQQMYPNMNP